MNKYVEYEGWGEVEYVEFEGQSFSDDPGFDDLTQNADFGDFTGPGCFKRRRR